MKVYFLSLKPETPKRGYWDYGFLEDFFKGDVWQTYNMPEFEIKEVDKLPHDDKAIIVIPARHHAGLEKEINKELNKINSGIIFLMGDEERDFDATQLEGRFHIWLQNPHMNRDDEFNKLGTGYNPEVKQTLDKLKVPEKIYDLVFSGQVTHQRRLELIDAINNYSPSGKGVYVNATKGFTQGLKPKEYANILSEAKVVPAPSGAVIPDSFRLFEGLEAMAVVIADQKTPVGEVMEYWDWLFGEITPFPKVDNWHVLTGIINELDDKTLFIQTSWWIEYKRNLAYKIVEQLDE